jgi:uncharacterized protein YkwD
MRRLLPLLLLGTTVALAAGCAQNAQTTGAASWVQPAAAVDGATPSGSADPSANPSADPSAPAASPSATPSKPGTAPKPPAPPPAGSGLVQQLLAQVNALRADHGLPPYKLSNGLIASAHAHNVVMMNGCGLSHRCPNEADLGPRIRAQGVNWHTAGENIGESGPNGNNQTAILNAAKGLTMSMYNEKPPDDGHRRNILSSSFTMIGIDVVRDGKGTVWLTQDFAG